MLVACREGVEPSTNGVEAHCSVRLSYRQAEAGIVAPTSKHLPAARNRTLCSWIAGRVQPVTATADTSMLAPDTYAVRVTGDFKAAYVLTTARNGRSAFRLFARHRLKHLPLSGVSPTMHQQEYGPVESNQCVPRKECLPAEFQTHTLVGPVFPGVRRLSLQPIKPCGD